MKKPIDLGRFSTCTECKNRYCTCKDRNFDGSIKKQIMMKKPEKEYDLNTRIKYGVDLKMCNDQKFVERVLKKMLKKDCRGNIDRFISECAATFRSLKQQSMKDVISEIEKGNKK